MDKFHKAVLLNEAIEALRVKSGEKYIDATLGAGNHSFEILKRGGKVLAIDLDDDAINFVKTRFEQEIKDSNLVLAKGNFAQIEEIALLHNFRAVSGILFDLGVSSHQIDSAERGFSFLREGPLDMRMDKSSSISAEILVNLLGKGELYELFNRLGQESRSRAISSSIISSRRVRAIKTTGELLEAVKRAYGIRGELSDYQKNMIGQKVFQALRIAVNSELQNLESALPKAILLLEKGGRMAVISFHSLEDGIVKKMFLDFENKKLGKVINKKPVLPSASEILNNPRSKSAKLRVFEKN